MRALVTGGAGFIGSHLTDYLLAKGHEVTIVDNLVTGQLDNLSHLKGNPKVSVHINDVIEDGLIESLAPQVDVIYHLAAAVGVRWIIENPLRSIQTNIQATEIVLKAAANHNKRILLASTSEVYGKNPKEKLQEDDDSVIGSTQITRWLYANSKATDEFLALAYHSERQTQCVIVRFFNTVGPRQTGAFGMVVPSFIHQALIGENITVHGDGEQGRCFTDVRDAVRAVYELSTNDRAVGQVFNIGNPREISIRALAELIIELTGSTSKVELIPYNQAFPRGFEDMRRRVPCTDKLHDYLGWSPSIPLEDNLARMIEYQRARLHTS